MHITRAYKGVGERGKTVIVIRQTIRMKPQQDCTKVFGKDTQVLPGNYCIVTQGKYKDMFEKWLFYKV